MSDKTILTEAAEACDGPRQEAYGHPLDNHIRIADMWSPILGMAVTPEQVILCMCATKIARQCHRPQRDNLVDLAGYARCIEKCEDEKKKRSGA